MWIVLTLLKGAENEHLFVFSTRYAVSVTKSCKFVKFYNTQHALLLLSLYIREDEHVTSKLIALKLFTKSMMLILLVIKIPKS